MLVFLWWGASGILKLKIYQLKQIVQIGQPSDGSIYNVTVENVKAENTGDDSIALFNVVKGGVVRNSRIKDSFARGILLNKSPLTKIENNTLERSIVKYVENDANFFLSILQGFVKGVFDYIQQRIDNQ